MEVVSITIPAEVYTALFARYEESTTATITEVLRNLAVENAKKLLTPHAPYSRPGAGTKTGRVWEIADRLHETSGNADRDAVIRACMEEGINVNTASTQFTYWKRAKAPRHG